MKMAILCFEPRLKYFVEYLNSLVFEFTAQGIETEIITELSNTKKITQFQVCLILQDFAKIDVLTLYDRGIFLFLLNTEQMSIDSRRNRVAITSVHNIELVDYSLANMQLANIKGWYLPYLFQTEEIAQLKKFVSCTKKYDVVFCGTPSKRRVRVLSALKKRGISILIVTAWGDERDQLISQGKILLNIHYKKSSLIFESIRCDRWIFAGIPVVSENFILSEENDTSPMMHLCEYDDLVETVESVLANYSTTKIDQSAMFAEISHKRKQYSNKFIEHIKNLSSTKS
jgi:hypothetical protein